MDKESRITKTKTKKSDKPVKKTNHMALSTVRKFHVTPGQVIATILVLLLALFFGKVALWEHNYLERMEGSERETAAIHDIADEGEAVDESQPNATDVSEYTVAADKPRYLSIPSLGITNARIVEVGRKANGEMATPYNIYDAGWYQESALPGSNRVAVIDGHGGAPGIGIFGSLPKIISGDTIQIEMGDGRLFTYQVVDTATKALVGEADAYMETAFQTPEQGKGSLTLITCTGDYWLSRRTYSHRFFARAVLVKE